MKLTSSSTFILAAALLAVSSAGAQSDARIQQIKDLRDKWVAAEESKDVTFLTQLLADECVIGNSQGQVLDKPHFLEKMASPDRIIKIENTRDVNVRLYGNVAIETELITVDGTEKGKPFGGEFRFIRIFARKNGSWHAVLGQGTPVKAPATEQK